MECRKADKYVHISTLPLCLEVTFARFVAGVLRRPHYRRSVRVAKAQVCKAARRSLWNALAIQTSLSSQHLPESGYRNKRCEQQSFFLAAVPGAFGA